MRTKLETKYYRTRQLMKTYTVKVRWKGYEMVEEYKCTESQIKTIVREFKQMKDRPWSVKVK